MTLRLIGAFLIPEVSPGLYRLDYVDGLRVKSPSAARMLPSHAGTIKDREEALAVAKARRGESSPRPCHQRAESRFGTPQYMSILAPP